MEILRHSVTIDVTRCRGCTTCLHNCPTKSIRVRNGKALILAETCIDCGECIRVCPHSAKLAVMDSLEAIQKYEMRIALLPPSFIGQFDAKFTPSQILSAVHNIGFDRVYEVAYGAEIIGKALAMEMAANPRRQYISSACPTVNKLVAESFPSLLDLLAPFMSPMNLTAERTRERLVRSGMDDEQIGVFFVTPCTAKATEIYNATIEGCRINGAIPIREVYHEILRVHALDGEVTDECLDSFGGQHWAVSGGEASFLDRACTLHVNGISNVVKILEALEHGELNEIRYFELNACVEGCVGGCLAVANPFVAKNRIAQQMEKMKERRPLGAVSDRLVSRMYESGSLTRSHGDAAAEPKPEEDISAALSRLEAVEELYARLPKFDCGSCGSPGCRAMAEDIVSGTATEMDCVFQLKDAISRLSKNMFDISSKVMPIMSVTEADSPKGDSPTNHTEDNR